MEFLMTYGWAILAAIIVIGVLAIYFRPENLAPNSVLIGAPFTDTKAQVSVGSIQIEIPNNVGVSLNVTSVGINLTSPVGITCTADTSLGILAPDTKAISTPSCSGLTAGDRIRGTVTVKYIEPDSAIVQKATGSINFGVSA